MAIPMLDNVDLGKNQLLNALAENLASDPGTPGTGRLWLNTVAKLLKFYDGTGVQSLLMPSADISAASILQASAGVLAIIRANRLDQMAVPTADVSFGSVKLTNLADPVASTDAVNLRTLLANITGLTDKNEVAYATAGALPANTYANGASGVGATLTGNANGALSVDGVAVAVGQRILVQNEAAPANNGIYTVTATGSAGAVYVLTRATDADQAAELGPGMLVPVEAPSGSTAGTANNQKVFLSIAPSPFVVGTSSLTFALVGGTYTAGTGLTLTGTSFALSTPVAIANGGTNATTAAAARTNLGAVGKFAATIGDGSTTAITVNHALGTTDVQVTVWETGGSKRQVFPTIAITDANNIVCTFATAPASNAYRVVVVG